MTTKHKRWTVKRGVLQESRGLDWIVYNAGGDTRGAFLTHALAVTYADRMARTVEIVLPRDNTVVPLPACMQKEEKPITLHRWGEQIIIECTAQGVEEAIFIHDDELKPLALALLAHHYRSTTP